MNQYSETTYPSIAATVLLAIVSRKGAKTGDMRATRLKTVALPAEHGGWALILEPIVLGLLLAPSFRGVLIGLAALSCFLTRQPLKLALSDQLKGRTLHRTTLTKRFAIIYGITAVVLLAVSFVGGPTDPFIPLLLASPLVVIQLSFDAFGHSRKLLPEAAGAIGVGSIATAITLAAGWPRPEAFALWAIVASRHLPTILYLRKRLSARRQGQGKLGIALVMIMQLVALMAVIFLVREKLVPALAVVAFLVLTIRATMGLFSLSTTTSPKQLGIAEFAFGAFTVLAVTVGYNLGW
jgi:hypothetical protein